MAETPEYSNYSFEDLEQALRTIDKRQYPEIYQALRNELIARQPDYFKKPIEIEHQSNTLAYDKLPSGLQKFLVDNKTLVTRLANIASVIFYGILILILFNSGNLSSLSKDSLAESLGNIIKSYNLNVFYSVTILIIIICISYLNDILNWKTLEDWQKGLILSAYFSAFVFILMSILILIFGYP